MMKSYARWITSPPVAWTVIFLSLAIAVVSAIFAARVEQDDDILAFLPQGNADVQSFHDVAGRFGNLDVALVGIESDDVFSADFLERLKELTTKLNETPGLDFTLSLTSVEDFVADPEKGGITADYLVREIPRSEQEVAALRAKVLSRDAIVGNLVSADGRAVMLYAFASKGSQPRITARAVSAEVHHFFPNEKVHFHGNPFVSTYIYDVTQRDLNRLAPWACVAIALIVLVSFRDLIGTILSLFATGFGVVVPLGILGFRGDKTNIVLGSMPVILFALGSAYGIHVLSRFYLAMETLPRREAVRRTLEDVGPSVLGSGITTSFGLLSFIMMDIAPMRTFGVYTALGLTISLVIAVTFIPAVLVVSPLAQKPLSTMLWLARLMEDLSVWVLRHKRSVAAALTVTLLASTYLASKVDSTLDTNAFFDSESPPGRADALMREKFGGSQFIQVELQGDFKDPAVLRRTQLLADRIRLVPGVTSVTHIGSVIAMVNEAMDEARHLPDTTEKVRLLYTFLTGKRAVLQTVTEDRDRALITIKVAPSRAKDVEEILTQVERITQETLAEGDVPGEVVTAARLTALAKTFGVEVRDPEALRAALASPAGLPPVAQVEAATVRFMATEAFDAPLPAGTTDEAKATLARAVTALGPPPEEDGPRKAWRAEVPKAVATALQKDPSSVDDIALAIEQNMGDIWTRERGFFESERILTSAGLEVPSGEQGERLRKYIGHALLDRRPAEAVALTSAVTGLPVLYRGLATSVSANQWKSLWFCLVLVIGIKALLFRSVLSGLISSVPTLVTLLMLYGGMGLLDIHLDIGTSMLASLVIGAGDDYAVQYLWSWSSDTGRIEDAARAATRESSAGIWVNALMVAAGFYVLTLGEAKPLQNVGGLTAIAMVAAAVATFIVTPLLTRRVRFLRTPT